MTDRTFAADAAIEQPPRRYLTAPQVLARYAISSMTLHRWLTDERLRFPPPALRIRERRLWLETDLLNWEHAQIPRGQSVTQGERRAKRR